jgi:hypothetical protein
VLFDETVFFEDLEEFPYIVFHTVTASAEFSDDLLDDLRLRESALEKFEDPGPDEVEVEHLPAPDIQDNSAILAVRAADAL